MNKFFQTGLARAGGVLVLAALFFVVGCSTGSDDTSGSAGDGRIPNNAVINSINALQAALLFDGVTDFVVNDAIDEIDAYNEYSKLINIPPGKTVTMTKKASFVGVRVIVRPGAKLYIEESDGHVWNNGSDVYIRPGATLAGTKNFYKGLGSGENTKLVIFPGANVEKGTVSIQERAVLGNLEGGGPLLAVEGNGWLAMGPSGTLIAGISTQGGGQWSNVEEGNPWQEGGEASFDPTMFIYDPTGVKNTMPKVKIYDSLELGFIYDRSYPANTAFDPPIDGLIDVQAPEGADVVFQEMVLDFNEASPFPRWITTQNGQAVVVKKSIIVGTFDDVKAGKLRSGSIGRDPARDGDPLIINGTVTLAGELKPTLKSGANDPITLTNGSQIKILKGSYFPSAGFVDNNGGSHLNPTLKFPEEFTIKSTDQYDLVEVSLLEKTALRIKGNSVLNGGVTGAYLGSGSTPGLDVAAYTFGNTAYTTEQSTGIEFKLAQYVVGTSGVGYHYLMLPNADGLSTEADGSSLRVAAGADVVSMKGVKVVAQNNFSSAFYTKAALSTAAGTQHESALGLILADGQDAVQFFKNGELKIENGAFLEARAVDVTNVTLKSVTFTGASNLLNTPSTLLLPESDMTTGTSLTVPTGVTLAAGGTDPIKVEHMKTLRVNGTLSLDGMLNHKQGTIDVSYGDLKFTGSTPTTLRVGESMPGIIFDASPTLKLKGTTVVNKTMDFGKTGTEGISWETRPLIELYASGTDAAGGGTSRLHIGSEEFRVGHNTVFGATAPLNTKAIINTTLTLTKGAKVTYVNTGGYREHGGSNKPTVAFGGTVLAESATLDLQVAGVNTAYVGLGKITGDLVRGGGAFTSATAGVAQKLGAARTAPGVPKLIINPVRAGVATAAQANAGFYGSAAAPSAALTARTTTAAIPILKTYADNLGTTFATPLANGSNISATWVWVPEDQLFKGSANSGWVFIDAFLPIVLPAVGP